MKNITIGVFGGENAEILPNLKEKAILLLNSYVKRYDEIEYLFIGKGELSSFLLAEIRKEQEVYGHCGKNIHATFVTENSLTECCCGDQYFDRLEFVQCTGRPIRECGISPLERYVVDRSSEILCYQELWGRELSSLLRYAREQGLTPINLAELNVSDPFHIKEDIPQIW